MEEAKKIQPVDIKDSELFKTNAEPIDELLNGGLEKGIITNFYGPSGSGKTNISIIASAAASKEGKKAIFIDTERGFSPERYIQIHNREGLKNIILFNPKDFWEQKKVIFQLKDIDNTKDLGIIVVDSLAPLYRLQLNKEKFQEINTELSKQLFTLSNLARELNIPVLITNQVYTDFDTSEIELVGKDIPKYYSKSLIMLEKTGTNKRKATITKHRFIEEGRSIEFEITYSGIEKNRKKHRIFS